MRSLIVFLLCTAQPWTSEAQSKAIPMGEVEGVKWFLAWASVNEERTALVAIVFMFVFKEVWAWIKAKMGKHGQAIERIPHIERDMESVKKSQDEVRGDMKELMRNFNALTKELHNSIRNEVKYAMDVRDRKRDS